MPASFQNCISILFESLGLEIESVETSWSGAYGKDAVVETCRQGGAHLPKVVLERTLLLLCAWDFHADPIPGFQAKLSILDLRSQPP
jgi:hypothetical protein